MNPSNPELLAKLNLETGKLAWSEVERHFARGVLVKVAADLDLVEVAACMADDDRVRFAAWIEKGRVARATTEDAMEWNARQTCFWAVVVAPWVLVQAISSPSKSHDETLH